MKGDVVPRTQHEGYIRLLKALDTVLEQAEDEGLWFIAKTAPEAYLQRALRKLHAVIEGHDQAG